ncbi:MAG: hypothetical protein AAGI13_01545 [Pseudomonadota bacterium]
MKGFGWHGLGLLTMGIGGRLCLAALVVAAIWAGFFWATGG